MVCVKEIINLILQLRALFSEQPTISQSGGHVFHTYSLPNLCQLPRQIMYDRSKVCVGKMIINNYSYLRVQLGPVSGS